MSRWGVQIEKSTSYRGATQPFSNTYYYEAAVANTPADNLGVIAYANDLLDDVIALERAAFSTDVAFVLARCWSQIGTQSQNEMIVQRSLTGNGSVASTSGSMDRERAFLVRLRAGVDSRGRPVYLRKYFHLLVGTIGGVAISTAMLAQTAQLAAAQRTAIESLMDSLKQVTPGAGPNANLVSKNGRAITGGTTAHPYLEHRQLGDAWRGT
jgi:hypothetical protein